MVTLKHLIDFFTLGSSKPMRRLVAYYLVLAVIVVSLVNLIPVVDELLFAGERSEDTTSAPQILQDGLNNKGQFVAPNTGLPPRVQLAISTGLILVGTLLLMLPVTWVYMSMRRLKGHNQTIVQTLLILPIVVAGIVLMVRNSLALAFSLGGVVAGVRFRTTLEDSRDVVFIFLAIAVGFAAGVQVLTVAALLSIIFNFVMLLSWHYDFGRNVLEPTAASAQWAQPLGELASKAPDTKVPDRDLVMALTPKKVNALADRFNRVRRVLGTDGKKPRYNAILSVTTNTSLITETQQLLEQVLAKEVKRWTLDEVVTNEGKPSELYYIVRVKKSTTRDSLVTAIRSAAGKNIQSADVELSAALTEAAGEQG